MPEETDAFVFSDEQGRYYVIPREAIERGLISDESKAKLEEALPDTAGHGFRASSFAMGDYSFVAPLRLSRRMQTALVRPDGEPPIAFAREIF